MQSEDKLQAEFFQYVWNNYPQLRRCMWAVPNGGWRNKIEAAKLKATGTLAGVWDLHVYYNNKFYIIETKVCRNDLSDKQIEWRDKMIEHGAHAFVYRTLDEGINIINIILNNNF